MPNKAYEQSDKDKVVSRCAEVGVDQAVKEIGYPARDTALKWCRQQGVVPARSSHTGMGAVVRTLKKVNLSLEEVMDKIGNEYAEHASEGNHDLINLKRLSEGMKIHVETLDKLKSKAGVVAEQASTIDNSFMKLVEEMNKKPIDNHVEKPIDKESS